MRVRVVLARHLSSALILRSNKLKILLLNVFLTESDHLQKPAIHQYACLRIHRRRPPYFPCFSSVKHHATNSRNARGNIIRARMSSVKINLRRISLGTSPYGELPLLPLYPLLVKTKIAEISKT